MDIQYRSDRAITPDQFVCLLQRTTLGARRPLDRPDCIADMLKHADLLITVWAGEKLIGIARSVTDYSYCCYLSDLAVDEHYQKQGIGQELIRRTEQKLKNGCRIILLAAPQAEEYYPHIGFERHQSAWTKI